MSNKLKEISLIAVVFMTLLTISACQLVDKDDSVDEGNSQEEKWSYYQFYTRPTGLLFSDEVTVVEVSLDSKPSDKIGSQYLLEDFSVDYTVQKAVIHQVINGTSDTDLSVGDEINVVNKITDQKNPSNFWYNAQFDKLVEGDKVILFLQYHSKHDIYLLYNRGETWVDLKNINIDNHLDYLTLLFDESVVDKTVFKNPSFQGMPLIKSDAIKYKPVNLRGIDLTIKYIFNEDLNKTRLIDPNGFIFEFKGKLIK